MPLPPWPVTPSPATWSSGPVLASQLRADVTNAVALLSQRPGFLGYCSTGPSIPSGSTGTVIALDTEIYDSWQGHDPLGTQPGWYYCRLPGWYLAEGYVPWNYSTATTQTFTAQLQQGTSGGSLINYTGEQHPINNTRTPGPYIADLYQMTAAWAPGTTQPTSGVSYIALLAQQASGSAVSLNSGAGQYPRLSVRWVATATGTTGLAVPSNPSWPVPPAYVTSSFLNGAIRDTIRALTYPPFFRGIYAAGSNTLASQSFPSGTKIALDTVSLDSYSGWNAGSNVWTCPTGWGGVYYAYAQVSVTSSGSAGQYAAGLSVNGGTTQWVRAVRAPANTTGVTVAGCKRLRLNAGDTVALMGQQSSGASLTIGGGSPAKTKLIMVWESS